MASINKIHPDNVQGNFFVDTSCIDCDTCRWLAPEIFGDNGEQSSVFHQPQNETEERKALQALLACPTASIGQKEKSRKIIEVQDDFPLQISENVYYCGYHSKDSYGAASYFIHRPEGNILIDSPRFVSRLAEKFEKMGGIKYMYLTHIDDIADHQKFHDYFNCRRIIHQKEAYGLGAEILINGDDNYQLDDDLKIIPVPGHTRGHTVLLYKDKYLFSGDHLAWSRHLNQLYAFRGACWYSWPELYRSMEKLSHYDFEWVLPGHGRRFHTDIQGMKTEMQKCLEWMQKV